MPLPKGNIPNPGAFGPYGLRPDGSKKGQGWLGPLKTKKGNLMTELSVESDFEGKPLLFPLVVPTLDPDEIAWLLENEDVEPSKIPNNIMDKAYRHAIFRVKQGLSPFKD